MCHSFARARRSIYTNVPERGIWLRIPRGTLETECVKIAVGRLMRFSGEPDDKALHADHQDYVVCPEQTLARPASIPGMD